MNTREEQIDLAKRLIATGISDEAREVLEKQYPEIVESEDERIRNLIYCIVRDRSDVGKLLEANGCPVEKALSWLEKQKEQKPAEITPNQFDGITYGMNGYSSENPAEWSEEDEDKVDDICKLIEHATIIPRSGDDDTGTPPTRLNDKYKGELKAFVKFLRNRLTKSDTWKPSEEQMEQLKSAALLSVFGPFVTTKKQYPALKSLLDDLNKL